MQQQQKDEIKAAIAAYIAQHGITANDMALRADVSPAYLSTILNGKYAIKDTVIADRYFEQLAEVIEYQIAKVYWQTTPTIQLTEIITTLSYCKEHGTTGMIIGETGCGKTFSVDKFAIRNPLHTYRITVSDMHSIIDVLNAVREMMGLREVESRRSNLGYLKVIVKHLKRIKKEGGHPQIVIDEAENLKVPVLKMLKALYDETNGYCSIVLIGTDQLLTKLVKLKNKNHDGMPQFYRRFKGNIKHLTAVSSDLRGLISAHVSDKGLQRLLLTLCDNYGEVHDYLEPVMRDADSRGVALTEDLFRLHHNLPKH